MSISRLFSCLSLLALFLRCIHKSAEADQIAWWYKELLHNVKPTHTNAYSLKVYTGIIDPDLNDYG